MDNSEILKKFSKLAKNTNFTFKKHKLYLYKIAEYIEFLNKEIKTSKNKDIEKYIKELLKKNISTNSIIENLEVLEFIFENIVKIKVFNKTKILLKFNLKKSKKEIEFLTKKEIIIFIKDIENLKHKLIIEILYSSGIKLSELLNLKIKDINLNDNLIIIEKNKIKRKTLLSKKVKKNLKIYLDKNKIINYLFENKFHKKYSQKNIEVILKKYSLNLSKIVTPTMLRNSFIINLLNNGIEKKYIIKILGLKKIKSLNKYKNLTKFNLKNIIPTLDIEETN